MRRLSSFLSVLAIASLLAGCGGSGSSGGTGSSGAVSVSVITAASVLDGTNTTTLTATVTNDKNAAGVNWSVTGGGALSSQTTSAATYTAPAATSAAQTITVTATSIADSSKTAVGSITVPAQLNVTTVNSSLTGAVGTAYNAPLTVTGGISPYTWTVASGSTLPAGLTMTTGGVLSGAPTAAAAGNTSVQFNVKDAGTPNGLTAIQTLTLSIAAAPAFAFTSSVPATATVNAAYAGGSAAASGGSGTLAYSISAGSLPTGVLLNALTGAIAGTPTAAGTFNFTVKVTDPFGDQATKAFQIVVSYPALNITTGPTLPTAYGGSNYSTALAATGGSGNSSNYTWALASGSQLPTGLTLSFGGTITGKATGSAGIISFTATVTDSVASLSASANFSITVASGGYAVTGSYYTLNNCAGSSSLPTLTMTINTPTPKQVTTDTNGNFSFANIPNGSYTITPSSTAPEAVFTPSTLSVTVNNGAMNAGSFGAQLGYNISGSVSYSGTQGLSNPVYVWVEGSCTSGQVGTILPATTMTSGGGFTIQGVPMGTYTLFARMDPQGNGFPMGKSFPVGQTSSVVVSGGNVSGEAIALSDPSSYAITTSPTFKVVTGTDQGVIVDFDMSSDVGTDVNGNRVIVSPNYQIEWSTTNSFTSPTSTNSFVFPATDGAGAGVVFLNNLTSGVSGSPFGNGAQLYFRMRGYVSSGSTNNGPWVYFGGSSASSAAPVTIGAATGSNTISGTVTFNGAAAGPLYVGYFSSSTGVFYGQRIQNPVSPQAYSVQVPTGTGYLLIAAVDNNNDGLIDAADFTNTRGNNGPPTASVTGSGSGQTIAIPTSNVAIGVTTQNNKWTSSTGSSTTYGVYFDIRYQNKVPVSAQLIGGPNVMTPVDIGRCGNCGAVQFQYGANLSSNTPTAGDTYTFALTYIDGTTENVTAQVAGVNTAYPTALMPQQTLGVSTTPTFIWNYPANPASYIYQFNLWSNNGTTIWRVPTSNSSSSGFSSTQVPSTSGGTGITWNVDPLGGSNTPNVSSLTSGTTYNWSITALDANGNAATRTIYFVP